MEKKVGNPHRGDGEGTITSTTTFVRIGLVGLRQASLRWKGLTCMAMEELRMGMVWF